MSAVHMYIVLVFWLLNVNTTVLCTYEECVIWLDLKESSYIHSNMLRVWFLVRFFIRVKICGLLYMFSFTWGKIVNWCMCEVFWHGEISTVSCTYECRISRTCRLMYYFIYKWKARFMLRQEFYRFVPNDKPKLQIFPQKGIKVEVIRAAWNPGFCNVSRAIIDPNYEMMCMLLLYLKIA